MNGEQAPNPQMTNPSSGQPGQKSIGPAIGIVIIILVIILGALYFWGQTIDRREALMNQQMEQMESAEQAESLPAQSPSDDLGSIEADLNTANFEDLGSEFDSVEAGASAQ